MGFFVVFVVVVRNGFRYMIRTKLYVTFETLRLFDLLLLFYSLLYLAYLNKNKYNLRIIFYCHDFDELLAFENFYFLIYRYDAFPIELTQIQTII